MSYQAKTVANSILNKSEKEGVPITPLKMQKLLYFLHGWYLALKDEPLLNESFEAWQYGPVLSTVYHALKRYGKNSITNYIYFAEPYEAEPAAYLVPETDTDFYDILDRVWDIYSNYSGIQLSSMTHKEGSPWDKAKKEFATCLHNKDIHEYFKKQMNE